MSVPTLELAVQSEVTPCCGLATASVTPEEALRLAPLFRALADPVRLRLASMIAASPEVCVCELTPAFEVSPATISHHLRVLREAGLVESDRRGTFVHYRIRHGALRDLGRLLSV